MHSQAVVIRWMQTTASMAPNAAAGGLEKARLVGTATRAWEWEIHVRMPYTDCQIVCGGSHGLVFHSSTLCAADEKPLVGLSVDERTGTLFTANASPNSVPNGRERGGAVDRCVSNLTQEAANSTRAASGRPHRSMHIILNP